MRIVVLGSTESWYLQDLRRAAGRRCTIVSATFRELRSDVTDGRLAARSGEIDLLACNAVLVRTMPAGSLEQVVFRMDVLAQLECSGVTVINPAKAIEAAVDKYLATARLQAAGMNVPRTVACQTIDEAMDAFAALGGDVVVKPLFGAEGRGIARLEDESLAWRTFKILDSLGTVIYLQPFIEHEGFDLRLLVIGDDVLGMKRINGSDWRTNVSRGAATEPLDVTDELATMARRAAHAVGAPLAGVDLLPGRDGQRYVLEVNAVPGWKALARTLNIDVAERVLRFVADC